MFLSPWPSWPFLRGHDRRGQRRYDASRRKKARLVLEPLEGRALLASYSASSVSALIADINAANTAGVASTITLTAATTAPYVLTAVNNTASATGANGLPVIAANDNLTIVGSGDTIERSLASGTPDFRLFDVAVGASLTLQSLTLQGGSESSGSTLCYWEGGAISSQGALTLSGVTVQQNNALMAGGGIFSYDGSVTLEGGSIVRDNVAGIGSRDQTIGGGGLYAESSTVTVTNATLDNNSVSGAEPFGGGICVYDSTVTVTNAALDNNSVRGGGAAGTYAYGGGLYAGSGSYAGWVVPPVVSISSTVTVTNTTLDTNIVFDGAESYGGGLCVFFGAATLSNDTVDSNTAVFGGGLCFFESTATLSNDTVDSNTAKGTFSSFGGGLDFLGDSTATLSNDTVESNTASCAVVVESLLGANGGGIYIAGGCTITLDPFTAASTINNTDKSRLNGATANIDGTYTLS